MTGARRAPRAATPRGAPRAARPGARSGARRALARRAPNLRGRATGGLAPSLLVGLVLLTAPGTLRAEPVGVDAVATSTAGRVIPALPLPSVDSSTPRDEPDPLRFALQASLIEGVWSIALTAAWGASARSWDAPYPEGLTGLATARVLYGTSWTLVLTAEVAIARLLAGARWAGLSRGRFSDTWLVGVDVPAACRARPSGGRGPCGVGLGSYGEVSVRVTEDPIPLRVALIGGWIQGRYDEDEARTLVESTWLQSPVSLIGELPLSAGPFTLTLSLGPGVYYGLHAAHVHPREGASLERSPFELVVLDGGAGPGLHGGLSLSAFGVVSLEADGELAWLALGGSRDTAPEGAEALFARPRGEGPLTFRRASVGVGLALPALYPVQLAARLWAAELSRGPIDALGHRAIGLELSVPIELGDAEDHTYTHQRPDFADNPSGRPGLP